MKCCKEWWCVYIKPTYYIGALVLDVGGRCVSAISKKINCSRKFVKKCAFIVSNEIEIKSNKYKCGRKKITFLYPELKNDIKIIIESRLYTDPHFETANL